MDTLKSYLSLDKLLNLARRLTVVQDEGYVQMSALQSTNFLREHDEIEEAVQEISSLRKLDPVYVMVNKMSVGSILPRHQDWLAPTPLQPFKGPLIERWHLPLFTNNCVRWYDSSHRQGFYMPLGYWCGPVPYWNHHMVINCGPTERYHLIVDLDCPEPLGEYEK